MYSQPYYIKFQEINWNNVSSHFTDSHTRDLDRRGGGGGRCARIRGGTVTVGYVPVGKHLVCLEGCSIQGTWMIELSTRLF